MRYELDQFLEDVEDVPGLDTLAEDILAMLDTKELARTCAYLLLVRGWEIEDMARMSGIPEHVFVDWVKKEKPWIERDGKIYRYKGRLKSDNG